MAAPTDPYDPPTLPAALSHEIAPPRGSAWRQLASVLGWRAAPAAGTDDAQAACRKLVACLADLPPDDTRWLCHLLTHAGSRAELRHLRPEVYRLLALHHSQAEAERRLAAMDPLFERRTRPARVGLVLPV